MWFNVKKRKDHISLKEKKSLSVSVVNNAHWVSEMRDNISFLDLVSRALTRTVAVKWWGWK